MGKLKKGRGSYLKNGNVQDTLGDGLLEAIAE